MPNHEVYHFQDVPLRKHGLEAFLESLLILSDFLIPVRESFQFHLHLIQKLFPPFIILNSIQRVVCVFLSLIFFIFHKAVLNSQNLASVPQVWCSQEFSFLQELGFDDSGKKKKKEQGLLFLSTTHLPGMS